MEIFIVYKWAISRNFWRLGVNARLRINKYSDKYNHRRNSLWIDLTLLVPAIHAITATQKKVLKFSYARPCK